MTRDSPLKPHHAPLAPAPHLQHNWQGLHGSASSLVAARLGESAGHLVVYVAADTDAAFHAQAEMRFYAPPGVPVLTFPDWETLPYDHFSAHQDIVSERLATLYELPSTTAGMLVLPVSTLLQRLSPVEFVQSQSLILEVGATIRSRCRAATPDARGLPCHRHGLRTRRVRGSRLARGRVPDGRGQSHPDRPVRRRDRHAAHLRRRQPTDDQRNAARAHPAGPGDPSRCARDCPFPRHLAPHVRCRRPQLPDLPGRQRRLRPARHRVLPTAVLRSHGDPLRLPAGRHRVHPGGGRARCHQAPPRGRRQPLRVVALRRGAADPATGRSVPCRPQTSIRNSSAMGVPAWIRRPRGGAIASTSPAANCPTWPPTTARGIRRRGCAVSPRTRRRASC